MAENRLREAAEHWERVSKEGQRLTITVRADIVLLDFLFGKESVGHQFRWTSVETAKFNILIELIDRVIEEMRWRSDSGLEPQTK